MGRATGFGAVETGERLLEIDAKGWAALPRARVLLSTLPCVPEGTVPVRPTPWEGDWRPRVFGASPEPMMRARGQITCNDGS
eukprot:8056512-Lingulodinium_polyedra.AAC.1